MYRIMYSIQKSKYTNTIKCHNIFTILLFLVSMDHNLLFYVNIQESVTMKMFWQFVTSMAQLFLISYIHIYIIFKTLSIVFIIVTLLLNYISLAFRSIPSNLVHLVHFGPIESTLVQLVHFGPIKSTLVHLVHFGLF